MFGRQRKKQDGQQRHQYEVANKYVFKCRLKVDSDDDDVTNDGKLSLVTNCQPTLIAQVTFMNSPVSLV